MIIITVAFLIITIGLTTLLLWPVSVLLHEIGHAIPMLLFSKKSVLICVWNKEKSKKFLEFNVNRLNFKLSYDSLFVSGYAQMIEDINLTKWKNFIINLWGPLFSIFLCGSLFYVSIYSNVHGFLKILSVGFLINSLIELIILFRYDIYFEKPYYQFSDGANLYHSIFKNYGLHDVNIALYKYYCQDFKAAVKLMKPIIEKGFDDFYFFHSFLISLCYNNSPSQAYKIYSLSRQKYVMSPTEKSEFGALLLLKGNPQGKELILEAFQSNTRDETILANKAFLSLSDGNYVNAINIFTYLCGTSLYKSYASSNLLLARFLNKDLTTGLEDFDKCILEFPLEAYAVRNKGIYLFENKNYIEAINCFRTALKLDENCYQIDFYLDKCLSKLTNKKDTLENN